MTWSEIYSYSASLFYHSPFTVGHGPLCKPDIWLAGELCVCFTVCPQQAAGAEQNLFTVILVHGLTND